LATVLIVEDDEHVRVLAELIVQAHGFQTLAADGSEQALAFFNDPDQQIDLLFTDVGLRHEKHGGLDLAQEAVRLRPDMPVLYTSGRNLTDPIRARFVDNSSFLPKPYTSDGLLWGVRDLLLKPVKAA
jgi:DNA-binding NtrC family response regulator